MLEPKAGVTLSPTLSDPVPQPGSISWRQRVPQAELETESSQNRRTPSSLLQEAQE